MMLCKADFEELFPELFPRENQATLSPAPSADCVARWEDDGGTVAPSPSRRFAIPAAQWAPPLLATMFGIAAIHAAQQFGKVAMPPSRRMMVAGEDL